MLHATGPPPAITIVNKQDQFCSPSMNVTKLKSKQTQQSYQGNFLQEHHMDKYME
jgi:hypothetical protein